MTALWTSAEAEAATLGKASRAFETNGLSIDTRTLQKGDLFVALQGEARDGHEFVAAALKAGAGAALVMHRPDGVAADAPLLTVGHTLRGLEDLARASRARTNAKIVAVTGSAGKTTTKEMLRLAFGALGTTHASAASYNNHWGVPLSLASMPSEIQFGIFEVGMNHFGELRNLVSFVRPHIALVTTIAPAHLEFFGNCEAIADAKSEIFEGILPGGTALIPSDSPYHDRLKARAQQAHVGRIVSFGAKGDARLISHTDTPEGVRIKADIFGTTVETQLGSPGAHIAQNAVGALASVAALDGDVLNAAAALRKFAAVEGRGTRFDSAGVDVIDESYNANPASMAAALAVLGAAQPKGGRRIAILGDMLEMGPETRAHHAGLAAPIEAAHTDLVFACGEAMQALWDKLPASRRGAYAANSKELAPKVMADLRKGDVALVKGSKGSKLTVIIDALKARAAG
jgi:UDP-N-acetylmuramoyl-tripeptide--D-alanyl-D-alanine ligase